ncbi:MAG: flagellar export chaperone FlgN [Treponema sp.]|nr:flagellar export chaperone FlgN [Treponema sp.]
MAAAAMRMPALRRGSVQALSPGELSQRVAVIKRFKELLKAQRDRFRAYLDTLDTQQAVIQNGTAEDLLHHVELEEKIVTDIFSIQKVIDPLEKMYQSTKPEGPGENGFTAGGPPQAGDEVSSLKDALEDLKTEAAIRSERNRDLLSRRMASLRSEIKTLRSNPYARRQANIAAPTQIDIRG